MTNSSMIIKLKNTVWQLVMKPLSYSASQDGKQTLYAIQELETEHSTLA